MAAASDHLKSSDAPGSMLYKESLALQKQYRQDRTNTRLILDSIDLARRAVARLDAKSPAAQAARLYRLGAALAQKYIETRIGSVSDLDAAISYKEQSLEIMPADVKTSRRAQILQGTATSLGWRYQAASESKDYARSKDCFERAKAYFEEAIHLFEESPTLQAKALGDLGILFRDRYYETLGRGERDLDHLRGSISILERALGRTPDTPEADEDRVRFRHVLGCLKGDLYQAQRSEPEADDLLTECLQLLQLVVDNTAIGHRNRAERLLNLGTTFQDRYLRSRKASISDLDKAVQIYEEALEDTKAPTLIRMKAGRLALDGLIENEDWNRAATVSGMVLDLLARITPRTHSNEDLERALRQFSGLGAVAASVFLRAGKSDLDALQILERGSSIADSLSMDLRTAGSGPSTSEPNLIPPSSIGMAASIMSRLSSITQSPFQMDTVLSHEHAAEIVEIQKLSDAFDTHLAEIQKLPGSRGIEQVPSESLLLSLAIEGPIVCFNVTYLGSHAFLITESQVKSISLDQLKLGDIEEYTKAIWSGYGFTRAKPKSYTLGGVTQVAPQATAVADIERSMEWLWLSTVKPVLNELGLIWTGEPPDELPSIWWVGGGFMATLPMHAAGYHQADSTDNTISQVISSYLPSLKALQFTRRKVWLPFQPSDSTKKPRMVIVAMPTTPGFEGRLQTEEETRTIERHVGEAASIEVLESPSKMATLRSIEDCTILHLACHTKLNPRSPFQSALLLGSGKELERLSVNDLRSIDLQSAQLAYLSACSTATFSDRTLPNESIHLASTFLLLFRHVIGTMWDAYDDPAKEIAGKFYEKLLCNGGTNRVSKALHQAICEYRSEPTNCKKILHWGPFLHTGP